MERKFQLKEEEYVIREIKRKSCKKVLLQLPDGLKGETSRLVRHLEKNTGAEIIVSGEPCWGGCDLRINDAREIGADLIVHYGHAPFVDGLDFPILYVEVEDKSEINSLLEKSLNCLEEYSKIGLVCSIQHIHKLEGAKKFFEKARKEIVIPSTGYIVGCVSLKEISLDVEAFVVIGNRFHSLGVSLGVNNPVYLLDVYNNQVLEMSGLKNKILKQRFAAIEKAKETKKIGIIVGLKLGQKFGSYRSIKEKLEKIGKDVAVITMGEISKDKLINFNNLDVFVELACPRIAIEDYGKYEKTLITFKEALVIVGEKTWEDLLEEGLI